MAGGYGGELSHSLSFSFLFLQASDSAARLKAEAEDTEVRYNRAHLGEF